MPSQVSSNFSSTALKLPLVKYSYATVSSESIVPIPWIHLSNKTSLFAIFDTCRVHQEDGQSENKHRLKVLQDPDILEELDLTALSVEAHRAAAQLPKHMMHSQLAAVTVMVKAPAIAVKFPVANNQIRRFQVRFSSDQYFYEALNMLVRCNVPITEAGSFPTAARPQTASLLTPDDSASQIGGRVDSTSNQNKTCKPDMAAATTPSLLGQNFYMSRPASIVSTGMLPPTLPSGGERQDNSMGERPPGAVGNATGMLGATCQSNISLTTGTTLVNSELHCGLGLQVPANETSWRFQAIPSQQTIVPPEKSDRRSLSDVCASMGNASELDLPPRRELPFPTLNSRGSKSTSTSGQSRNIGTEILCMVPHEQDDEIQNGVGNTNRSKRKRTTTKPPAAKKPRTVAARKKAGSKSSIDEAQTPGVEKPLPTTRLATRAQREAAPAPGPTQRRIATLVDSHNLDCLPAPRRISEATANVPTSAQPANHAPHEIFPCTPAGQMIDALVTATKSGQNAPVWNSSREEVEGASTEPQPVETHSPARLALSNTSESHSSLYHDICPIANPGNAARGLASWREQPKAVRDAMLNDFMVQALMDPNFVELCKSLEAGWTWLLMGKRVDAMNSTKTV